MSERLMRGKCERQECEGGGEKGRGEKVRVIREVFHLR